MELTAASVAIPLWGVGHESCWQLSLHAINAVLETLVAATCNARQSVADIGKHDVYFFAQFFFCRGNPTACLLRYKAWVAAEVFTREEPISHSKSSPPRHSLQICKCVLISTTIIQIKVATSSKWTMNRGALHSMDVLEFLKRITLCASASQVYTFLTITWADSV